MHANLLLILLALTPHDCPADQQAAAGRRRNSVAALASRSAAHPLGHSADDRPLIQSGPQLKVQPLAAQQQLLAANPRRRPCG